MFNILAYFHEVETGERYTMQTKNAIYSGLGGFDLKRTKQEEAEADGAKGPASPSTPAEAESQKKQGAGDADTDADADADEEAPAASSSENADQPPPLEPVVSEERTSDTDAVPTNEGDGEAEDEGAAEIKNECEGGGASGDATEGVEETKGGEPAESNPEQTSTGVFTPPPEVVEARAAQRRQQAAAKEARCGCVYLCVCVCVSLSVCV